MNLCMLLDMATDGFGSRIVIGPRADGFTAEQLRALSIGGAEKIRSAGADSVIYLDVNGPAFPVAMFAAARAGVPLIPVNYRLSTEQLLQRLTKHPKSIGIADPRSEPLFAQLGIPVLTTARLGSAGLAVPGIEIEIRDGDGTRLPPMSKGRIWVRGEQVSGEYAGIGSVLDADGFFDTRDEGYLDHEGYLFIGGRTDDTIIRGAENIAPAEIEETLIGHPDVADAVVVGVPDPEWGQHLEAAVVPEPGHQVDPEAVRAYVRARLRSSKTPDRILVWQDLPRTETGKLVRRQALDRILDPQEG